MVACYLTKCGMRTTAIWDERYFLAAWSMGGNVRAFSEVFFFFTSEYGPYYFLISARHPGVPRE